MHKDNSVNKNVSTSETLNKPKKKRGRPQKKKINSETLSKKRIPTSENSRKVANQRKAIDVNLENNTDNNGVDKLQIHGQSFHLFGDCSGDDLGDLVEVVMTNDDVASICLNKSKFKKYMASTKAQKGQVNYENLKKNTN